MTRAVAGIAAGIVVSLTGCGGDETDAQPSRGEVKEIRFECQFGTDGSDLAEPDTYEKCLEDRLDMTPEEVTELLYPTAELPACEELWVEGAVWESDREYNGTSCRSGPGEGKRYVADMRICFNDEYDIEGLLIIGPDDLYVWRSGGPDWDSPVQDGSEFSERAGELKVDLAKRRCENN